MKQISLVTAICLLFFALAFHRGVSRLELRGTDEYSERQALGDARSIAKGEHRFGIVQYTHYPNGPSYMLVPSLKWGITDRKSLRMVPVIFSASCLTLLVLGLLLHLRSPTSKVLAVGTIASLLWQPGVVYWMGALHEHSYVLCLCFAGVGVALMPRLPRWILCALAFVNGWMGYDLIFGFVFSVLAGRWLAYTRTERGINGSIASLAVDGVVTCLGTGLAIAAHVAQNALFFGSFGAAINDLFGSAAARAGLEVAKEMNPDYVNFLTNASQGKSYSRFDLSRDLINNFSTPIWVDQQLLLTWLVVLTAVLVSAVTWRLFQGAWPFRCALNLGLNLCAVTLLAVASAETWILVMPEHARFHFHFLPRHFFVPLVLLAVGLCSLIDLTLLSIRKRYESDL